MYNEEYLDKTISWEVQEEPMTLLDGTPVNNFKMLTRSDTRKQLHATNHGYNVFSNAMFIDLAQKMADLSKGQIVGYQSFDHGKKMLGFIKPGECRDKIGENTIKNYIVIGNSHNQTSSVYIGTSTTIIRCKNAFSQITKEHAFRHSTNMEVNLERVIQLYAENQIKQNRLYDHFNKMRKIKIDTKIIVALTDRIFKVENAEEISTQKANQLEAFDESLNTEMTDLGKNMWGFFNAVTHYSTHKRGRNQDRSTYDQKNSFGHVLGSNANFIKDAFVHINKQIKELA